VLSYMETISRAIELKSFSGGGRSTPNVLEFGPSGPVCALLFSLRKGAYSLILPSTERTSHKKYVYTALTPIRKALVVSYVSDILIPTWTTTSTWFYLWIILMNLSLHRWCIQANGLKRSCGTTGRLKTGGNLKANRVEATICFWNHVEWW
jgi:hypothetical protein